MNQIHVVSARTQYEHLYPQEVGQWKQQAFLDLVRVKGQVYSLDRDMLANLMVVGDGDFEIAAGQNLAHEFERCLLKTVKMVDMPTPDELIKQLKTIGGKLDYIINNVRNMNIKLER